MRFKSEKSVPAETKRSGENLYWLGSLLLDSVFVSSVNLREVSVYLRLHRLVARLASLGLCNSSRIGAWSTRRNPGYLELRLRRHCNGDGERHHAKRVPFLNWFQSSV